MKKYNIIVLFFLGLCLFLLYLATYMLCYVNKENNFTQKLCTQQQYDFYEVIEQKLEYKLKELKQDEQR